MSEKTRQLPRLLREICAEHGISIHGFSGDWIFEMDHQGKKAFVIGYKFPNNDAAMEQICDDKCALSDVLTHNQIPCVPHTYFMRPDNQYYMGTGGDWEKMMELLRRYGKVVCKSNSGSGGTNVFKASTMRELEAAVCHIFSVTQDLAIAPYVEVENEYRCIVCEGQVRLIYRKLRPFVVGDGKRSAAELIAAKTFAKLETDDGADLSYVPADGEKFEVSWKHNIGRGASPEIIEDPAVSEPLVAFALKAAGTVGARFASVDVIQTAEGLKVLEINSGVMMEGFAAASAENYARAKAIYGDALLAYFARA